MPTDDQVQGTVMVRGVSLVWKVAVYSAQGKIRHEEWSTECNDVISKKLHAASVTKALEYKKYDSYFKNRRVQREIDQKLALELT